MHMYNTKHVNHIFLEYVWEDKVMPINMPANSLTLQNLPQFIGAQITFFEKSSKRLYAQFEPSE